jgi:hypothetical protein
MAFPQWLSRLGNSVGQKHAEASELLRVMSGNLLPLDDKARVFAAKIVDDRAAHRLPFVLGQASSMTLVCVTLARTSTEYVLAISSPCSCGAAPWRA